MVIVKRLPLGQMAANCYLVFDSDSRVTLIIDPADESDFISRVIEELDLKPKAILASHGHFDHLMAAAELKLIYRIPFCLNPKDSFLVKRLVSSSKKFSAVKTLPIKIDKALKEGDKIKLGKEVFKVKEVPGHTPGSVCFLGKKVAFIGDLFFKDGTIGRYDFSYADKRKLLKSIEKVLALGSKITCYPGHGEEFLLRDFKVAHP
jgi:glyoxylase-like metal-dependent hydrolase (beta-lactamase superfamily II)